MKIPDNAPEGTPENLTDRQIKALQHSINRRVDCVGQRFGKLVVIEMIYKYKQATKVKCRCDCGNVIVRYLNNLKQRSVYHCGCSRSYNRTKLVGRPKIKNTRRCKKCGKKINNANRYFCSKCHANLTGQVGFYDETIHFSVHAEGSF